MSTPNSSAEAAARQAAAQASSYAQSFPAASLPVLAMSAYQLEDLKDLADQLAIQDIAHLVDADPFLMARLFATLAKRRAKDAPGEPDTALEALQFLGVQTFFRSLGELPKFEEMLEAQADNLAGFEAAVERARRAARLAQSLALASQRGDFDSHAVRDATLLWHVPECLLWWHSPRQAASLESLWAQRPGQDTVEGEQSLLGFSLEAWRDAQMRAWGIPESLRQLQASSGPGPSGVRQRMRLAIQAARYTGDSWDAQALWPAARQIAELLQLGLQQALQTLKTAQY
jgi:hypothetical protein